MREASAWRRGAGWARSRWPELCCALALALCLSALALIGPALIYDDARFLASFQGSPMLSCLAPFRYEALYWRPLGTLSMCAPLWASGWTGQAAAIAASKAFSVALAAVAACAGVVAAARMSGVRARKGARSAAALACLAALLGFSPALAEPTMWLSGRFDALLMALLMGLMLRMLATSSSRGRAARVGEAALWGLALCASKESGAAWAGLLSLLLWARPGARAWSAGLGASLAIYLPLRAAVAKWWIAPGVDIPSVLAGEWRTKGALDMGWSFLESLGRQALMLAAPALDLDPAHGERLGPGWVYALGMAVAVGVAWAWSRRATSTRRGEAPGDASAWACAALAMMALGAAKAATVAYPGELLSPQLAPGRFIAPSAMVLWTLAGAWVASAQAGPRARWAMAALAASAAMCLAFGWGAREEWSDELMLKEAVVREGFPNTWSVGNLAAELDARGQKARAQALAIEWIAKSPDGIPMCELWAIAQGGPKPLDPAVAALVARRRAGRPGCPVNGPAVPAPLVPGG